MKKTASNGILLAFPIMVSREVLRIKAARKRHTALLPVCLYAFGSCAIRYARARAFLVSDLLASASPTMTCLAASHFSLRPTTEAMYPRWPGVCERWAISTGVSVRLRDLMSQLLLVTRALVKGDFKVAFLLAVLNVANPLLVGGVDGAAVNPDPAVGADPFRAALNIAVSSGDDDFDIAGILAFDAVLGGGVPDLVFAGKLGGGRKPRAGSRPRRRAAPDFGLAKAPSARCRGDARSSPRAVRRRCCWFSASSCGAGRG